MQGTSLGNIDEDWENPFKVFSRPTRTYVFTIVHNNGHVLSGSSTTEDF